MAARHLPDRKDRGQEDRGPDMLAHKPGLQRTEEGQTRSLLHAGRDTGREKERLRKGVNGGESAMAGRPGNDLGLHRGQPQERGRGEGLRGPGIRGHGRVSGVGTSGLIFGVRRKGVEVIKELTTCSALCVLD